MTVETELKVKIYACILLTAFILVCTYVDLFCGDKNLSEEAWVTKTFENLSEEERIAQLFMVATYAKTDERHYKEGHDEEIKALIERYNIGGLIFFRGDSDAQQSLTNQYQKLAKTKLLIAMDAEWGVGMRLTDAMCFPKQMTLGALQDNKLIYEMGGEIARQLRAIGVHINFAPVIDVVVNSDVKKSAIGRRSFGADKCQVADKGVAYIQGMQANGVTAVAKHFPGHGDTYKDSHKALPIITHDYDRIDRVELFPFKKAIQAGVGGIMSAHLLVTACDDTITSFSPKIITTLLKETLGFNGLCFTDALNMKAISKDYGPGEAEVLALQAGNDVLVFSKDVPKAIKAIQQAIIDKKLDQQAIHDKVKRILTHKYKRGLHRWKFSSVKVDWHNYLKRSVAYRIKQRLFEQAITVVSNEDNLIPIKDTKNQSIASLSIICQSKAKQKRYFPERVAINDGSTEGLDTDHNLFVKALQEHASIAHYTLIRETSTQAQVDEIAQSLSHYSTVIVGIHNLQSHKKQYGFTQAELQLLQTLKKRTKLIVVPLGNVHSLKCFTSYRNVIAAYEDDPMAMTATAKIIFGALPARGKLPISISENWPIGTGVCTESPHTTSK